MTVTLDLDDVILGAQHQERLLIFFRSSSKPRHIDYPMVRMAENALQDLERELERHRSRKNPVLKEDTGA